MAKLHYFLLLPALLSAGSAIAERTFKWVDKDGQIHYGNQVPPEYARVERKVINEQGRTIKIYEAAKTPEEKDAAKVAADYAAKKKALADKQATHDRSLLATYASEQDMLLARDGKVTAVEAILQLTNSRISSMKERLLGLSEEAADYERSGKALPPLLEGQINNLRLQAMRNEAFVVEKEAELLGINARFDADIRRYAELTVDRVEAKSSSQRMSRLDAAKNNPDLELTRHDRTLLTTYADEEDLRLVRDQQVNNLNELITLTSGRIESMQLHFSELSDNADEYESSGQKMPEVLLGQMKNVMAGISQGEELLALKLQEKSKLVKEYSDDIKRYRQLTASKQ